MYAVLDSILCEMDSLSFEIGGKMDVLSSCLKHGPFAECSATFCQH